MPQLYGRENMTRPLKMSRPIPEEIEKFHDDFAVAIQTVAATTQMAAENRRAAITGPRGLGRRGGFDRDS
jgi:hypothetical protein